MKLKLRGKKNAKGQKVWAIYERAGGMEKLVQRLGIVPRALAEKVLQKLQTTRVCNEHNIRQNVDVPFPAVCTAYLDKRCKPPHKKPKTYAQNVAAMRQVVRVMAKVFARIGPQRTNRHIWIHEVTLPILDSYKVERKEEGVSNRTINIELNLIRGVIRYALDVNCLIRFPFDQFKNLTEEETERVWLKDPNEVEKMIDAGQTPATRLKIRLGFEAGLRFEEILQIKLEAIDIPARTIRIFGEKEGRFKDIEIGEEMAAELGKLIEHRYDRSGNKLKPRAAHQKTFLFCKEDGSSFRSFRKAFGRAKEKAGIDGKFSPHGMRHTFASHLLDRGANPADVAKLLGHKKTSTTMDIYAHTSRESRRRSFEKLPYLRRPEADVIPLRRAVGENVYGSFGSKSGEELLGLIAKYMKINERETGFEPATLSLGSFIAPRTSLPYRVEKSIEFGVFVLAAKTVSDPF